MVIRPGPPRKTASQLAQRIQEGSQEQGFASTVTPSIGSAALEEGDSASDLLRRADRNMYDAKRRHKASR